MSEQEWLNIFGDNLRDILKEQNMSQDELADACGLSKGLVSQYIHKRKMPSIKTLINMSYVLNIRLDEFADFGEPIELYPRDKRQSRRREPEHRINWDEFEDLEDY